MTPPLLSSSGARDNYDHSGHQSRHFISQYGPPITGATSANNLITVDGTFVVTHPENRIETGRTKIILEPAALSKFQLSIERG